MECPKCGGGTYLAEEELVQVLEGTRPLKAVIKATFVCRACAEKVSRLVCDTIENRKEIQSTPPAHPYATPNLTDVSQDPDPPEGLRFF